MEGLATWVFLLFVGGLWVCAGASRYASIARRTARPRSDERSRAERYEIDRRIEQREINWYPQPLYRRKEKKRGRSAPS